MLALLADFSAEVTRPDRRALDEAARMMPAGAPVYIAALPRDPPDAQIAIAVELSRLGLRPIPHIVARKIADHRALDTLIGRFVREAGVDRALVLAGDRESPVGDLADSLAILESGVLEQHGIAKVAVACYPEGHPRIAGPALDAALRRKLEIAAERGFDLRLISQLCFDADIIADYVAALRRDGVTASFRVGLAGPTSMAVLLRYAAICGVGASARALTERRGLALRLGQRLEDRIVTRLAERNAADPALAIHGLHFFTFGALSDTLRWVQARRAAVAA